MLRGVRVLHSRFGRCDAFYEGAQIVGSRYYTLDAMRGIAALCVLWMHTATVLHLYMPHAYLAVDFFFTLSGFVLGLTYEADLRTGVLSTAKFLTVRIVRLYPLYVLGIILGAVLNLGRVIEGRLEMTISSAIGSFLVNLLWLPSLNSQTLFPFDGPAWSLFFEMAANVALALFIARLPTRPVAVICCLMASLVLYTVHADGNSESGPNWDTFGAAIARVLFAFPLGILLARLHKVRHRSAKSLLVLAVLFAALIISPPKNFTWVSDSITLTIAAPLLVFFGSRYELPNFLTPAGKFLGEMSYPLYIVHYPILHIFLFVFAKHFGAWAIAPTFVIGMAGFAWFLSAYYDAPIRRMLTAALATGRRDATSTSAVPIESTMPTPTSPGF